LFCLDCFRAFLIASFESVRIDYIRFVVDFQFLRHGSSGSRARVVSLIVMPRTSPILISMQFFRVERGGMGGNIESQNLYRQGFRTIVIIGRAVLLKSISSALNSRSQIVDDDSRFPRHVGL
jgi:hypothetical protein